MLLLQKLCAELLAAHAAGLDAGECIERAPRLKTAQAHIVEALHHEAAAHIILVAHPLDLAVAVLEGRDGGVLAGGGGAHDSALVDLGHDLDDGRGTAGIAQPPARHGVGLGEAVDHHRPLGHAGQSSDGNVVLQAVVQLRVDLIRQHHDVGAAQDFRDGLKVFPLHHRAGRIIGEGHDEELGLRGDSGFQGVGPETELILLTAGHMDRHTAGQGGDGLVADEARLRDDDLIAGLHQSADAHVDGLTAADGDENFLCRVVFQAHPAVEVAGDLGPQLFQARVGSIAGAAMLEAFNARLTDGPGGLEVGLADAEADALGHLGGEVEEFADAGGAHGLGGRRDQFIVVHHSTVHSLSSISSS